MAGNIYSGSSTGSISAIQFKIWPEGEQLKLAVWRGNFAFDPSSYRESDMRFFPMTDEGMQQLTETLESEEVL